MTEKILNHYDYQDIEVKKHFKWMYLDYYPCFGWDVLETMPSENRKRYLHISLRRDYDIPEKDRLTHYQSKFDNCRRNTKPGGLHVLCSNSMCGYRWFDWDFFSDGGIQFYKCRRQSGSLFDDTGIGSFIFGISLLFGSVSCKTETDGAFYPGTV